MSEITTDDWTGLYREGWGKRLRPASFAHPAKNAYSLSVRIYEHAIEEGWVKPGDYVVDCFSGVGGFALEAMRHGLHFVGVELEQRFCDMGQGCDCTGISKKDWVRFQGRWDKMRYEGGRHWCPECIMKAGAIANERAFKPLPLPGSKWAVIVKTRQASLFKTAPSASYARNSGRIPYTVTHHYRGNVETWTAQGMPGTAIIVQGDSRRLGEVLAEARLCLSSPPYGGNVKSDRTHERRDERRLGTGFTGRGRGCFRGSETYGHTEGNLGNLPDTGFEAALALGSPPFIGSIHGGGHGIDAEKQTGNKARPNSQALIMDGYGTANGQLAALPEGDHAEACERSVIAISSPPWQDIVNTKDQKYIEEKRLFGDYGSADGQLAQMPTGSHAAALEAGAETGRAQACISSPPWEKSLLTIDTKFMAQVERDRRNNSRLQPGLGDYGSTAGQLGQETGSTFWAASREILEQVYKILAPGAHAIWVLKMFVRSGRLVDFPGQWETLCQSVGFKTVCKHRAWLNKNAGITQTTLDGSEISMEKWFKSFFRRLTESKGSPRIDFEIVLCMVK